MPVTTDTMSTCDTGNTYNGDLGTRISAIFVILVGSFLGAWFPVFARRRQRMKFPEWPFFVAKYFGSGIIIATAFIHLLAPANEALANECLGGVWTEYPWPEGIALMTVFTMFFGELMVMRYAKFDGHDEVAEPAPADSSLPLNLSVGNPKQGSSYAPGEDHLGHEREHKDNAEIEPVYDPKAGITPEAYSAQLTAVFILEFGVVFHSIFIGLTLAVAGSEFVTLYIVLVFHQTFEGLGLGSRLATVPWPRSKRWTPYILATIYGITTPLAIAVGLGVRKSFSPESHTTLVSNGIFDSISAGILLYTGLVELMAHEFMFSPEMSKAPAKVVLSAFGLMCLGAGIMALLGKWA